jgi:hypothetical protein
MATIFLSYKGDEKTLAESMGKALEAKGHTLRLDTKELVAGDDWRKVLFHALHSSDVAIALLSRRAIRSQFVAAEIGEARAFIESKGMLLLPVIVGRMKIPHFVEDLFAIRLASDEAPNVETTAEAIDRAIARHIARLRGKYPPVFISHRHKDEPLVRALVEMLAAAFGLGKGDIRCTSVRPYKLPAGERTSDRLRTEIRRAKAVLGIVTPDTQESSYVLFELGAAWGQGVLTFPLLARGSTMADIPPPISDRHPLNLTDPGDCQQLLEDLADATEFQRKQDGAELSVLLERLVEMAGSVDKAPVEVRQAKFGAATGYPGPAPAGGRGGGSSTPGRRR